MALPRHIREAGRRAIEEKLGEILTPTLAGLKASKTKQLGGLPDAGIPKVVSFPSS